MARVVKRPVYGCLPSCARTPKISTSLFQDREDTRSESSFSSSNSTIECSPRRKDDFLRYEDTSDEEDLSNPVVNKISNSFVDLVSQRTLGFDRLSPLAVDIEYGTRHLLTNNILRECTIKLGQMNKIFCSQWLNNCQIVFGSKCNKLTIYDTFKRELFTLPLLKSLKSSQPPDFQCGIHSLAINPSRTILATGAENTNDIAFYKLPTFDPLAVGEGAHEDWMFDVVWLDDYFLVSGSRDTTMALWKLDESVDENIYRIAHVRPLTVKQCKAAEKVRALAFNQKDMEVAALSLNGYIHIWKADNFKQMASHKLHQGMETVCLSYHNDHSVYAIGSRSHTTILDARTLQPIQNKNILSLFPTCVGIRSVSFRGDILTIGTGTGAILFYDLRAAKYLHSKHHHGEVVFKTNTGWVQGMDETSQEFPRYAPAIYTHCYDESGTRLFAAGGPLAVERQGNYASLWS